MDVAIFIYKSNINDRKYDDNDDSVENENWKPSLMMSKFEDESLALEDNLENYMIEDMTKIKSKS